MSNEAGPIGDEHRRFHAYHEAGHAIAAAYFKVPLLSVDIRREYNADVGGETLGSAVLGFPNIQLLLGQGEEQVMRYLFTIFAGIYSEQIVNPGAEIDMRHPEADGQRAQLYATAAICPVTKNSSGDLVTTKEDQLASQDRIAECIKTAKEMTKRFVDDHRSVIAKVAEMLLVDEEVEATEVDRILEKFLGEKS